MYTKITVKKIETRPDLDAYRRDTNGQTYTELSIDPANRAVFVTQEGRSNSTTMAAYHRLVLQSSIQGHPDEAALKEYLDGDEAQELMATICDGHDTEWNGHNMVGKLTDEAEAAWATLVAKLDDMEQTEWEFWAIDDWASEWAAERIAADMTDEQVVAKATELDALATAEHVTLSGSTVDYLTNIRNDKRDDE